MIFGRTLERTHKIQQQQCSKDNYSFSLWTTNTELEGENSEAASGSREERWVKQWLQISQEVLCCGCCSYFEGERLILEGRVGWSWAAVATRGISMQTGTDCSFWVPGEMGAQGWAGRRGSGWWTYRGLRSGGERKVTTHRGEETQGCQLQQEDRQVQRTREPAKLWGRKTQEKVSLFNALDNLDIALRSCLLTAQGVQTIYCLF